MITTPERFYDAPDDVAAAFPMLRKYLGAVRFEVVMEQARAQHMQDVLSYLKHIKASADIQEIAQFEAAMQAACEAHDVRPLSLIDYSTAMAPQQRFTFHPSLQRLLFSQNTTTIWSCLKADQTPPRPFELQHPQAVVLWCFRGHTRFRMLSAEENAGLRCAQEGQPFQNICRAITGQDTAHTPAERMMNYLRGWFEAEMLVPEGNNPEAK
jgi:hypothetical protein